MGSKGLALVLLSPKGRGPVLRTRVLGGPSELLTVLGTNLNVGSRQRDLKAIYMPGKTLGGGGV